MGRRVKLAFSTLACPRWSVEEVAAAGKQYGYEGVEIRLIDGRLVDPSLPPADRKRVREAFNEAGLPIVALDTSVKVAADPSMTELVGMMELANEWGAPIVRVFGGGSAKGPARQFLGEAAAKANRLGVTIALETHDEFSSAEMVVAVVNDMPASVGALWDIAHTYRVGEDAATVLRLLEGRIAHVHIKDARRDGSLTLLGEGDVPVRASLDALASDAYDGWISVEWEKHWHPELSEPEVALPQFAALLKSWSKDA